MSFLAGFINWHFNRLIALAFTSLRLAEAVVSNNFLTWDGGGVSTALGYTSYSQLEVIYSAQNVTSVATWDGQVILFLKI